MKRLCSLLFVVPVMALGLVSTAVAVNFPHGVASGDVTDTSVILWTRTDQAATLTAEV